MLRITALLMQMSIKSAVIRSILHTINSGGSSVLFKLVYQNYLLDSFSSIAAAAFFPAPIARITVAAPVTVSPPA